MSRCYPFPPPGYEKKAPQLPADVAQPHKDKKERHKHKDKKKKVKKEGDANGDTHDKDSSRPSKQPRTALIKELLQPPKEEKQNGKVRDERIQSTATVVEPSKAGVRDGSKASAQRLVPPAVPSQPLYSKQEPNGTADDAKPVLVLPTENSSVSHPSSRPGSSNIISIPPANNFDIAQRQSPELAPDGAMLVLKQPSAWSDVPDEDWLLAGRSPLGSHPKPKADVERADVERGAIRREEPPLQVWAEAVFLPSCDLYALPYVVPY